jgi:hypothetical protein
VTIGGVRTWYAPDMWAVLPVFLSIRPALLRDEEARPSLSGPEEVIERGRFRLHFTRSGKDAPDPVDADLNRYPDLVDEIVTGLIDGEREYVEEGWRSLVSDMGEGGSTTLDVYIHEIDAYGYATPVPSPMGGSSCFLEIDEDIQLTGGVARSVAKHELHHCIEFRYTPSAVSWLYEAAATYEQYTHVTDPVLDYALGVLYVERLATPELKLSDTSGRFEYAAFLWMKYWSEAAGYQPGRLPALWQSLEEVTGTGGNWQDALELESQAAFGQDLGSVYLDHAIWNSFACSNDDAQHYLPELLPCIAETSVPLVPWDGERIDLVHEDGPFTASYLELPADGDEIAVSCDGSAGLRLALVSVDADGSKIAQVMDSGEGSAQISSVPGGTIRVVVAGTSEEPLQATCTQQAVRSWGPSGCSTLSGTGPWGLVTLLVLSRWGRRDGSRLSRLR